ncbi:MAG: DUF4129 domain-containing protein [Spirochaetia bacterium]|nr:DUF4129 domain-containing protein [Spirochaetia bacterium]
MRYIAFALFAFASWSSIQATPPEWTKDMPWYDQKKETYRDYSAEDIKPYLGEEEPGRSRPSFGGIPDVTVLLYALIAMLVGVALYFAARYWMDRSPGEEEAPKEQIDVAVFFDDLPEARLPEQDLRRAIDELLMKGNIRRAGMLLFQLTLKLLVVKKLLEVSPDQTPREIQTRAKLPELEADLLHAATGIFEECAYRPAEPEVQVVRNLKERVFAL